MSFDLMVFDKEFAPEYTKDFEEWYKTQTKWTEEHNYDDPLVTSERLKNWFLEMIETFPAMNGPYAKNDVSDENEKVTDYCIGKHIIYACFSFEEAEEAFYKTTSLAEKYDVGFLDANSHEIILSFPPLHEKLAFIYQNATNERFEQDMKKYTEVIRRVGISKEDVRGWTIVDFMGFDENNKPTRINIKLGNAVESFIQKRCK